MTDSQPAAAVHNASVLATLSARLLDPASSLPLKYRVLYSLRNLQGEEARHILAAGAEQAQAIPALRGYGCVAMHQPLLTCCAVLYFGYCLEFLTLRIL